MFIDASAICAILAGEADAVQLSARIDRHDRRLTSALAIWEASVALSRIRDVDPQIARRMIDEFLGDQSVRIVAIEPGCNFPDRVGYGCIILDHIRRNDDRLFGDLAVGKG